MKNERNNVICKPVDILSFNARLSFVEAVDEDGLMDVFFTYDTDTEWVEIAEGGYVVESFEEYHPINVQIGRIIHENLGQLDESHFTDEFKSILIQYICDELYDYTNGVN